MTRNLLTGTVVSQFIDHLRHNARRTSGKAPSAKRTASRSRTTIPPGGNLRTEFGRYGASSFAGHVVDTTELARKLWSLIASIYEEESFAAEAHFIGVPPSSQDSDGFLKEQFWGSDVTHANDAYGQLYVEHLIETVRAAQVR